MLVWMDSFHGGRGGGGGGMVVQYRLDFKLLFVILGLFFIILLVGKFTLE